MSAASKPCQSAFNPARRVSSPCFYILLLCLSTGTLGSFAQSVSGESPEQAPSASVLKQLSLEQLLDVEVTSVSRRPEKLSETASAIQVITGEDIRRSGATRLPEALRLASNLQIAQINSAEWAISARGFNSSLANKMLVMIDGRTVYSPLFAGVFWDIQDVLLEDVERIEVVSGPGGTVWGANAVNGVINVMTKSARETQGFFVEGGGGSELNGFGSLRYGGAITSNLFFRVYGKIADRDSTDFHNSGLDADDDWQQLQGGYRLDWEPSETDQFTVQGDFYQSTMGLQVDTDDAVTRGLNAIGRWTHTFSDESDLQLQVYFDQVHRDAPGEYNDLLNTYDVDFQHRFPVGNRHSIVWGLGYRFYEDNFRAGPMDSPDVIILDPQRTCHETYSAFIQDEITLIQDRLHFTVGTKVEHNDYTDFEIQPSVRLVWNPTERQSVWGAISRAVRTPARIDRDLVLPFITTGSPNLDSEELLAYELGYRIQPHERVSISLATFYNDYDDIRSIEQVSPPLPVPLEFDNQQKAESYGAELTVNWAVTDSWRLHAGYTAMHLDISAKSGSTDDSDGSFEAADSEHYFTFRSSLDLPGNFQFDAMFRVVSEITNPDQDVPAYCELDLRLAWQPIQNLELSVVGQNLLHREHVEFGTPGNRHDIERGVYGKVSWRF